MRIEESLRVMCLNAVMWRRISGKGVKGGGKRGCYSLKAMRNVVRSWFDVRFSYKNNKLLLVRKT